MCGILAIYNINYLSIERLKQLFLSSSIRGSDGCGVYIFDIHLNAIVYKKKFLSLPSHDEYQNMLSSISAPNLLIANFRAQPETEVKSSIENLQPIDKAKCIVAHNGCVDQEIYNKYIKSPKITEIDSEAIIDAYIDHKYDIVKTVQDLIGGYATFLLDIEHGRFFAWTDYKPLYYAISDSFFIFASLPETINIATTFLDTQFFQTSRLEGFTIKSFIFFNESCKFYDDFKFVPRYKHPTYIPEKIKDKTLYIVLASGGIDSGLTAWTLAKLGYDVCLLHFNYGQKGQKAEEFAIHKLASAMKGEKMKCEVKIFDLTSLYQSDSSQLIDPKLNVSTGTDDIKSTIAWVSSRNLVFSSYAISYAEQKILKNEYSNVLISAGFFNLTESGIYPDNSEYFGLALNETIKYGTIVPTKIRFEPVFANVMKAEEWVLGSKLDFPFKYTVSCDEPIIKNGRLYLCDNCGSTKLSRWAAELVGIPDPRKFYHVERIEKEYLSRIEKGSKIISIEKVIEKLILPQIMKDQLLNMVKEKNDVQR